MFDRNAGYLRHTFVQEKLYGSREEFERTTHFISTLVLQVWFAANAKKKKTGAATTALVTRQRAWDNSISLPVNVDVKANDLPVFDILQSNGDILDGHTESV